MLHHPFYIAENRAIFVAKPWHLLAVLSICFYHYRIYDPLHHLKNFHRILCLQNRPKTCLYSSSWHFSGFHQTTVTMYKLGYFPRVQQPVSQRSAPCQLEKGVPFPTLDQMSRLNSFFSCPNQTSRHPSLVAPIFITRWLNQQPSSLYLPYLCVCGSANELYYSIQPTVGSSLQLP